ncbi:MAG: beta-galactosidase [Planctomycetota bacterium]
MAVVRHQRPATLDTFWFGVPYYPEHWSADDRKHDATWMAAADVNVVRMAEFAWDRIEPAAGELDFSLFDDVIAELGGKGISTILCTPTATPPRWLTAEHPDWMRIDEDGRRMHHGSRQHCCTTNPEFRQQSRRITAAMAEHYADNPHVIAWQTDNELNCHFSRCYCPACKTAFQQWLEQKYGSLDELNRAWGAAFWAQTYHSFGCVPLPTSQNRPAYPNPSAELDYARFLSDMVGQFQAQQVEELRKAHGGWKIFHNGLFTHIDYWQLTEELDFLGVDVYPGFAGDQPAGALWGAMINENCRQYTGSYIIPEQQGGPGGQKPYLHKTPQPGQMRLWAYQSIAHGADGMLHFRWRTCRYGAEMYWNGIIGHDNVRRRRYEEFAREGAELKRIGPKLLGTTLDVQAAVLTDHDAAEAYATMKLGLPNPWQMGQLAYGQLWQRHLPCGLVDVRDRLEGLKLLIFPSLPLMDAQLAGRLEAFVRAGGVLLASARSATRDRENHVFDTAGPALLSELFGATVEEFGRLDPGEATLHCRSTQLPAGAGYEILKPGPAEVLGTWDALADGGPFAAAGAPAVTVNRLGQGAAIYVGTFFSSDNVAALVGLANSYAGAVPLAGADEYVEITRRRADDGRSLLFVLNHYGQARQVDNLPAGRDLLGGSAVQGPLTLDPYGVAIIDLQAQ